MGGSVERVVNELLDLWEQFGDSLSQETGASDSLIHVHAGMIILFLARLVTKKSLATFVPFGCVLAAALLNEVIDRITFGAWRLPDAIYDVVNTVFWPLMLMIGLRWREPKPRRSGRR